MIVDASDSAFLPCPTCEYDLRGQPLDGQCPECGELVAFARQKNTLHHADAQWLKRLAWAIFLSVALPLAAIAIEIATRLLNINVALSRAAVLNFAAMSLAAFSTGPWLMTSRPAPSNFDQRPRSRIAVRYLLVLVGVLKTVGTVWWYLMFPSGVLAFTGRPPRTYDNWCVFNAVETFVVILIIWTVVEHIRTLVRRIPRSSLDLAFASGKWLVVVPLSYIAAMSLTATFGRVQSLMRSVSPLVISIAMCLGMLILAIAAVVAAIRIRDIRRLVEAAT